MDNDGVCNDQTLKEKLGAALAPMLSGTIDILWIDATTNIDSDNDGDYTNDRDRLQFNFNLKEVLTERSPNLDFDIEIPGLGLKIASTLKAKTSYSSRHIV